MKSDFVREVVFYGAHFGDFYQGLDKKTKLKVDWTINLLETVEHVPEKYFKHLSGTDGLMKSELNSNLIFTEFFPFLIRVD